MKILNYAVAVLFATFVVVQFNDPDPWLWVMLYGAPIVIALFAAHHRLHRGIIWAALAVCIGLMAMLLPGVIEFVSSGIELAEAMSDQRIYVEQTREFFGLAIVAMYYLGLLLFAPRKKLQRAATGSEPQDKLHTQC